MKAKLDSLLGRTSSFPKRVISLLKNHTFLQIQNLAKYKMCKLGGFNSKYLKYNPPYLLLFITNRCNLSCKFCPYHGPHRPSNYSLEFNDMSMDVFKRIISRFSHAVEVELGGGGEAFLHSHIFEMINHAHQHRMRTRIPTNGLVLHEMLDKVTHSPLSHLNISLNACDSDEFFQLHGGSEHTYNTLLEDISKLVSKRNEHNQGLRIRVSYICTKTNYKSIPDMVKLAEDLGVDEVSFINLIPCGIPGFSRDQCLYDDDADVIEVIKSVPSPKSNLKVIMLRVYKRKYDDKRCDWPFRMLSIDANGNVSPCCEIVPQKSYGNVLADKEVWNNSAFQQRRKIFVDKCLPLPDFCKTCHGMVSQWRPVYLPDRKGIR